MHSNTEDHVIILYYINANMEAENLRKTGKAVWSLKEKQVSSDLQNQY